MVKALGEGVEKGGGGLVYNWWWALSATIRRNVDNIIEIKKAI